MGDPGREERCLAQRRCYFAFAFSAFFFLSAKCTHTPDLYFTNLLVSSWIPSVTVDSPVSLFSGESPASSLDQSSLFIYFAAGTYYHGTSTTTTTTAESSYHLPSTNQNPAIPFPFLDIYSPSTNQSINSTLIISQYTVSKSFEEYQKPRYLKQSELQFFFPRKQSMHEKIHSSRMQGTF